MNASPYLLEYLRLEVEQDEEAGVNRWAAAFDRAREGLSYDECQGLLLSAKSFNDLLHTEGRAIVWHCQGAWLRQLGQWHEAIRLYERSLAAFRAAGNRLGEA